MTRPTEREPLEFGALLRQHRIAAGLTQEALADRAAVGIRSIQDLERGIHQPHGKTLRQLAQALHLLGEPRRQLEAAAHASPRRSGRALVAGRDRAAGSATAETPCPRPILPDYPTSFIGRERELADVRRLVEGSRLVTVTGPAGVGKTRLAIQAASALASSSDEGIVFVPLSAVIEPGGVVSAIAEALGVRSKGPMPLLDAIRAALRNSNRLIILDNFEQVASAAATLSDLLASCPRLKVLVTSRAALRTYGEQEFPLTPLAVPDSDCVSSLDRLEQAEAVRLFVERARAVKPGFVLTDENAEPVVGICRRLDGLPLAIELAAVRVRLFGPSALLARLASRLDVLTTGPADRPIRQQTLRSAIAWSYDLLDDEEQALFRRLSVFLGGFDLAGARAVGGEGQLDRVDALVGKSLVRLEESTGEPRFGFLETIREFGLERLNESGEGERVRRAHVEYLLRLAEEANTHFDHPDWSVWLESLDHERHNLRAALEYVITNGDAQRSLSLARALLGYWLFRGIVREGSTYLAAALSLPSTPDTRSLRARALRAAGYLALNQLKTNECVALLNECLALSRPAADDDSTAQAMHDLGDAYHYDGDYATSSRYLEESIVIYRRLGNRAGLARALCSSAGAAVERCDFALASTQAAEAASLSREFQLWRPLAMCLNAAALVAHASGDLTTARAAHEESLRICRTLQAGRSLAHSLIGLAHLSLERNDGRAARRYLSEGLVSARDRQYPLGICRGLDYYALLEWARGDRIRACRLLGVTSALRQKLRVPRLPLDRAILSRAGVPLERPADEGRAAQAWDQGAAMSEEEAIEYALEAED